MAGANAVCPGSCVLCRQPERLVTYQIWTADGQPRGRELPEPFGSKASPYNRQCYKVDTISTVLRQLYRGLRQHLAVCDMIGLLRSWHHLPVALGAEA